MKYIQEGLKMMVEYKGFKGEKIIDDYNIELILLSGKDIDELVWIEDDEIRATNKENLNKILSKYNITDAKIREEKLHPGLMHFIVDI